MSKNLYQLPPSWIWTSVGEIAENIQYGTSEKSVTASDGIPVLRMGNIQDGKISFKNLKYLPLTKPDLNRFILQTGDVLFNRTNSAELVGKSAVYKNHYPKAAFASYLIKIKIDMDLYAPDILVYFINSINGRKYIASVVSQQVGQANVNGSKLSRMPIPLIPINEQHKILEKLEMLFSHLDAGVESLRKVKAQLKRYRQAVLKSAFEGKLTEEWRKTHGNQVEPAQKLLEKANLQLSRKPRTLVRPEIDKLAHLPSGRAADWRILSTLQEELGGEG